MNSCFLMLVMMLYQTWRFEMQKGISVLACLFYVPTASGKWKLITHSTKIEVAPAGAISEKDAQRLLNSGMEREKVEALKESGMSATDARKLAQKVADAWESAAKKGWTVSIYGR